MQFQTLASHVVLVQMNVPYPASQKRTVSTKSTLMSASNAVLAQMYVPLKLLLLSNLTVR